MDINALLQMLQKRFGQVGGQQLGANAMPGLPSQGGQGMQGQLPQPGMIPPNPLAQQGGMGQQQGGGANPLQMIMQMMQRGQQGGGAGRQMNLG